MEMIIAGDVVPTENNNDLFESADVVSLLGESLADIWFKADMRIFNLETPITDNVTPIRKTGAKFAAAEETINGIKALKPGLLTLANNHILDQGEQGLRTTMNLLLENNIPFTGVGKNIDEASKPYIVEKDNLKIGVYACADHEFSIAGKDSAGANFFDVFESFDRISNLKKNCDYVIVLYHGGKEHYRYPSPYLQKACRKMVEKGADLVVCQHSHCIGSKEEFNGSVIVYGQGNFLFNYRENEYWKTSLLLKIRIEDELHVEYFPVVQTDTGIKLATGCKKEEIMSGFIERSLKTSDSKFIEEEYNRFAEEAYLSYLYTFAGYGRIMKAINRRIFKNQMIKMKYNEQDQLRMLNILRCEQHREVAVTGIRESLKKNK